MKKQVVELRSIEKITNEKYLNLFRLKYDVSGMPVIWNVASRRSEKECEAVAPKEFADAVCILPYSVVKGKVIIHLIREFRYPLNRWVVTVPAGLVDEGESEENAAKRELIEEIGASIKNLTCVKRCVYSSTGMTDEKCSYFEARVVLDKSQHLDETENIEVLSLYVDEVKNLLKRNDVALDLKGVYLIETFLAKLDE